MLKNIRYLIIIFVMVIFSLIVADVYDLDNYSYQSLQIQPPLIYYDLRLWDFFQAVGALGALLFFVITTHIAYKTWGHENYPLVHAVGRFLVSTDAETNKIRNKHMKEYNSLKFVNVGRGTAKNVSPSVSCDKKGLLLEDFNNDSFPLAGNRNTDETFQVHGIRFKHGEEHALEGDENKKNFYIHYEDYKDKEYITKVEIERVQQAEGELGGELTVNPSLQLWKVKRNIECQKAKT